MFGQISRCRHHVGTASRGLVRGTPLISKAHRQANIIACTNHRLRIWGSGVRISSGAPKTASFTGSYAAIRRSCRNLQICVRIMSTECPYSDFHARRHGDGKTPVGAAAARWGDIWQEGMGSSSCVRDAPASGRGRLRGGCHAPVPVLGRQGTPPCRPWCAAHRT
jgi:hypothetical protein